MPTLGTVLVQCWLYTTSKYGISTDIKVSSTVGTLLVCYCRSRYGLLVKYRQVSYANLRHSTGLILAVNRIQILAINQHRNLIDSWRLVDLPGAVQVIITGKIPTKDVCQPWAQYWLSACCTQHPNIGFQLTCKSRRKLAFYLFTDGAVLIIITGKIPTKEVCQPWAQYWLSAGCIQHLNTGYHPT